MGVSVVIADDQELVRTGFKLMLNAHPGIEVVGEASNGREAVEVIEATRPDVALVDVRMPVTDGIEATRQIVAARSEPPTRVIILTTFDLDEYVYEALRAGASGFMLKDVLPAELTRGVLSVADGSALLAPSITRRLIERFSAARERDREPELRLETLTAREHEVLRQLARGLTNAEIAAELILGEQTIKTHVSNLLSKLGVRDRVQAVVLAYETGVVRPGRGTPV